MKSILESIANIEAELVEIRRVLSQEEAPKPKPDAISAQRPRQLNKNGKLFANSLPATDLGPAPSIEESWPSAVDQKMIALTDSDKQFRALQIATLIKIPISGKVILDCGCGEGHNASEIANQAALKVVGYDIKQHSRWATIDKNNLIYTDDKQSAVDHGPYDLIILFDVIDHIVNEDPIDLIKWLSSLLSKDGKMFIRTHPWVSRTGGHYYEFINKAFIHLVFTPDEAVKMGIKVNEPNLKVVRPMAAYEQWFKDGGLDVIEKRVKTSDVEPYFNDSIMDRIVKINWGGSIDNATARKILSNHFIEYVLKKSI